MSKNKSVTFCLFCLIIALTVYSVWIEPNRVEVHRVVIKDSHLARVLAQCTVVQLSDLHMEEIGKRELAVLQILDELDPDIIFLTGDYVRWRGDNTAALDFFSKLHARIGVWGVMGDYDGSNSRKSCLFCHEEGSGKPTQGHAVRFLRDAVESMDLPGGTLWLGGLGGPDREKITMLKDVLSHSGATNPIILSHSPLAYDFFEEDQDVLILAGDTHGGQIPMSSRLLDLIGYEKNALYSQGLFEKGRKKMFVSRGIGTSHFPVRFLRPPEIAVFHFIP